MGGDGGEVLVEQVEPAGGAAPLVEVGQGDGLSGALVGHSHFHLWGGGQAELSVHHGDGVFPAGTGLVDPVLNGNAVGDSGSQGEEVTVDASHHRIAQFFRRADGPVDGSRPVDGTGCLNHNGIDFAVGLQLQGKALHPSGAGVVGDSVSVDQPVGQSLGGIDLSGSGGGEGGWGQQSCRQHQSQNALGKLRNGRTIHDTLLNQSRIKFEYPPADRAARAGHNSLHYSREFT